MKKQLTILGIVILLICVGLSGCEEQIEKYEDTTPSISFEQDSCNHTLAITNVSRTDILWSNLEVKGENSRSVGTYVELWNNIEQCYGTITIIYTPTNTQIESFSFSEIPSIEFLSDDVNNTLTVVSLCPTNIYWNNVEITGLCDTSNLGTYITEEDIISNCFGTISFVWKLTDTSINTFDFSDIPSITFVSDNDNRFFTVSTINQTDILWSDIEITGSCDISNLGTYVTIGDKITDCSDTIIITHKATNTVLDTIVFYVKPIILFEQDDYADTLTVTYVDRDNVRWIDDVLIGGCWRLGSFYLSKYVTVGDEFPNCDGEVSVFWMYAQEFELLCNFTFTPTPIDLEYEPYTSNDECLITIDNVIEQIFHWDELDFEVYGVTSGFYLNDSAVVDFWGHNLVQKGQVLTIENLTENNTYRVTIYLKSTGEILGRRTWTQ